MKIMSRRRVLMGTLGVTTAILARPYVAKAQSKTATVWFQQGFVKQEDEALKKTIAAYEKISGNKLEYSIMPFRALNQKAISALTSGDVPDLIFHDAPTAILPQNAWHNRLVDMSDVVKTQELKYSESALLSASFYNGTTKKRSYYMAPVKQNSAPYHIWSDLVRKGRLQDVRHSGKVGRPLELLQAGARSAAQAGHAPDIRHRPAGHDRRAERRQ